MTPQYIKYLKKGTSEILDNNVYKKAIIYTNTAVETDKLKKSLDTWLNKDMTFKGDVLSLYGQQEVELKAGLVSPFTREVNADVCFEK